MNPYGNGPQNQPLREERYAGEFLQPPSMSAPQPIPEKSGGTRRRRAQVQAEMQANTAQGNLPEQSYAAQPMPQDWSQHYAAQGMPQDWQQPYAGQGTPQDWQQPYAPQGAPQDWQQPYASQGAPQDWQQPYAPQGATQDWQQPYVGQPGPQDWQPQAFDMPGAMPPPVGEGNIPPVNAPIPEAGKAGKAGNGGGNNGGVNKDWWKWALVAIVAVALAPFIALGGSSITHHNEVIEEVAAYNDRFCQGVYVDGIHLGGMTQDEAVAAVNANAQERLATWNVSLTYGGRLVRSITAGDLGMTVNVHDALAEAWEYGHATSDVAGRKAAMDALLENPYYGYTAIPSGDTSAIDRILNSLAAPVYRAPQDATVTFDPEAHSYPFEYTPEVYGTYLDVEPIKRQIYGMVETMESGSIELQPQGIRPNVTEADLRAMRTLRGTATTEISTTSTDERTGNIQRAFQLINGTVLQPGESFSFNGIVGPRTAKNGFLPAIEYAYGNERLGYGGGVCQASTTIYLAAIRADVTITHREPHSDKVNYTEYGLDATVNYDGKKIDLTFKNTTDSEIYIMAYLERGKRRWICRVDIYGAALPEGVTYDLIAETVEVLPAPVDPEYVEDEDGDQIYYIDETPKVKRKASDGYIVETFKVEYHNGVEVNRTYVARDTYKAKSQQLWVGVHDRE